jgi:glycosyltransferase involved in cell wall biosynthesis
LKKKILIISQYFPPDISGGGTRAFNYAKCLAMQNFDVTVITAFPHLHTKIPKKFRFKLVHKEKMEGFELIRVRVPSLLHTSAKNRIILHSSFLISCMIPIFSIKPDVVFASEPNLFSIIPAFFYSKLRGSSVIRVVDDLWPEALYERGYVKSKLLKRFLNKLTKFSYTYAKFIFPLTEIGKQIIHESYNIVNDKIIVLNHGVDTNIFRYTKPTKKDEFVLMYSGSFVESYDFDLIINAAEKLQNEKMKIILRGKGTLLPYLENKIKEKKLKNIIIDKEIVPLEQISKKLSEADVFLIPMKNEIALNSTLPTKILEYQAMGRPIICCSEGAPGIYVDKTRSGIKIKYENLNEFIKAIEKLKSEIKLREELGQNGKKYADENLTFEIVGKILSRCIQECIRK